jgi:Tfp pilus tip-associated adhesin PilY1
MTYSIASDLAAIDRNADGFIDRVYAPDTGGNVWRVDVDDPDPANLYLMLGNGWFALPSRSKMLTSALIRSARLLIRLYQLSKN